jgi:hypothetical protein
MCWEAMSPSGSSLEGRSATQAGFRTRWTDYLLLSLFLLVWVIPIALVGLTDRRLPFVPASVNYHYRIAALFTKSAREYDVYFIQALQRPGQLWTTIPIEQFSRMELFGYLNRLDIILEDSRYLDHQGSGKALREKLAAWCVRRARQEAPRDSGPVAIRFLRGIVPVQQTTAHMGRWQKPRLEAIPRDRVYVMGTYWVDANEGNGSGSGLAPRVSRDGAGRS